MRACGCTRVCVCARVMCVLMNPKRTTRKTLQGIRHGGGALGFEQAPPVGLNTARGHQKSSTKRGLQRATLRTWCTTQRDGRRGAQQAEPESPHTPHERLQLRARSPDRSTACARVSKQAPALACRMARRASFDCSCAVSWTCEHSLARPSTGGCSLVGQS